MRLGRLVEAQTTLDIARSEITGLGQELLDDLDSRQLELDMLAGRGSPGRGRDLAARLGQGHPLNKRVSRCEAMALSHEGSSGAAKTLLETDLFGEPALLGYERALSLLVLASIVGDDQSRRSADLERESSQLFHELGVVRPPPLRPADLRTPWEAEPALNARM